MVSPQSLGMAWTLGCDPSELKRRRFTSDGESPPRILIGGGFTTITKSPRRFNDGRSDPIAFNPGPRQNSRHAAPPAFPPDRQLHQLPAGLGAAAGHARIRGAHLAHAVA